MTYLSENIKSKSIFDMIYKWKASYLIYLLRSLLVKIVEYE